MMRLHDLFRGALRLFTDEQPEPAPETTRPVEINPVVDRIHGEDEIVSFNVVADGRV
jgi:hypothetical protein